MTMHCISTLLCFIYNYQAEIDSACELADFFRFNCFFAKELMKYQPISEDPSSVLNLMRYRPLEGFIASVTPFNFTAIAGNLAYTPCIMVSSNKKLKTLLSLIFTGKCYTMEA